MWWYVIGVIIIVLVVVYFVKKRSSNEVKENPLEKYMNQTAEVTESISDTLGTGKVKIDGLEIQARRGEPGVIKVGEKVKIVEVGTNTFKVKPL